MRLLVLALLLVGAIGTTRLHAEESEPVEVASGISYTLIGRWDTDKLNAILSVDTPKFFGITVAYTPAKNAVRLYRVSYTSVIPERGNQPTVASGLLAVPDTDGSSFPLVSYQHGTVYGHDQVPSFPDQSAETQLMVAQFAGQGYLLIGSDYFGLGTSKDPEGYMVKASHQQATYDMLMASRAVLAKMNIAAPKLFIGGWSQGGFVTMALLEKLEDTGVKVDAAATASAPVDIFVALSGFLDFPRKIDADWVTTLFILSSFSFENYYGVPGLARSLINDEYYDISKRAYDRADYDPKDIPTNIRKLIRPEYFNPQFFAASAYGRLVAATQSYRWIIKTPVRNYYGEADEVISQGLGRLVMTYQNAIGNGNNVVDAISTGPTTHRGTFAKSVPQWKIWFDSLK
ncbi:alpha/beta hydrolase [Kaistia algarum]|nr:alpha/beta hydrolase [Kaistia algarum]MCX5514359.1 alpha/beta hydrolase [Kaistia algarum]